MDSGLEAHMIRKIDIHQVFLGIKEMELTGNHESKERTTRQAPEIMALTITIN